jgi:phospholipase D1/2
MRTLEASGVADRIALLYPNVSEEGRELDVMVHSKVMVVDDVLLRVGSANLNNRSSGFDTECDLAIEAQSMDQRRKIEEIRNRMLGHHCGATEGQVSASLARTGSLIKSALELCQHGHSLQHVCDDIEHASVLPGLEKVGDPERPIAPPALLQAFVGERPRAQRIGRLFKLTVTAIVVLLLVVAWRFTPLSALAHPDLVRQWLVDIAGMRAAPLIVVAVFVLGGLVGFPVLLLIAATAAAFGHGLDSLWPARGRLRARLPPIASAPPSAV